MPEPQLASPPAFASSTPSPPPPHCPSPTSGKSALRQFKRLDIALDKFLLKQPGVAKTNVLRTRLLPFLRQQAALTALLDNTTTLALPAAKMLRSFATLQLAILSKWWRALLLALNLTGLPISALDKHAYLECVLRIMSRPEWARADLDSYLPLLTETLEFCVLRLQQMKAVPVSMCAFVGKVFAYGFFHLPHVCNALLFLLNVKQKDVSSLLCHLGAAAPSLPSPGSDFPPCVRHLVRYRGLQDADPVKRRALNAVPPPKHPVRGIRDPNGLWVHRWLAHDSDVFNAFFHHYVQLSASFSTLRPEDYPGFYLIFSHVYRIFASSMAKIAVKASKLSNMFDKLAADANASGRPRKTDDLAIPPLLHYKLSNADIASIIKIFRNVRDINYSGILCAPALTRLVDSLLVQLALSVNVFDLHKNGILLNLVHEFLNYVIDPCDMDWEFWLGCNFRMLTSTHHVQIILRSMAFLFNVWEKVPSLLTRHDDPLKVLYLKDWLVEPAESFKENFAMWLISSKVWLALFAHWNPVVRAYYHRLLVWRIIGVNNYQSSLSVRTSCRIRSKLEFMHESVCEILSAPSLPLPLARLDFTPDNPLANRKLGIIPINPKLTSLDDVLITLLSMKYSELRKTHPYEIFDEAIYTCSSLPSSPTVNSSPDLVGEANKIPPSRNHSLINSLGKFFKMLSTDDQDVDNNAFAMVPPHQILNSSKMDKSMGRHSRSTLSLSTLRSGFSPLKVVPDFSVDSPASSDSDASSSYLSDYLGSPSISTSSSTASSSHPPELSKVPPEIVRPLYKFDFVVDHEASTKRYTMMQAVNMLQGSHFQPPRHVQTALSTIPKLPKVPCISIFLNSDAYNKIVISNDADYFHDEAMSEGDIREFEAFGQDFALSICNPTELSVYGKSLNEWRYTVKEFETYLFAKVEADQTVYFLLRTSTQGNGAINPALEMDEGNYFMRLVPFVPIDNFTELKLLNAS